MGIIRKKSSSVKVKDLIIGGGHSISVQTMTNLPLKKVQETIDMINRVEAEGASLVRVAIRTLDEVKYLQEIINNVDLPLCGDIHFNHRIAVEAIKAGINKIRLNPGNIGSIENVKEVVNIAQDYGVPIRIGVNGGSVDRKKFPEVTPEALVESAMEHVHIFEDLNFTDIVLSIKSSNIFDTIEANRLLSNRRDYPIHVGLTEAGYGLASTVQSSITIGHLLLNGIGDTIRVSMTGDPLDEVRVGKEILKSLGTISHGVKIISCPTCGRTDEEIDLLEIAREVEGEITAKNQHKLRSEGKIISIAVMGCEVNGPGEAAHADLGIASARGGRFLLFSRGEIIKKIGRTEVIQSIQAEIDKILEE